MSYASRREAETMVVNAGLSPVTHTAALSPAKEIRLWYPQPSSIINFSTANLWQATFDPAESVFGDPDTDGRVFSASFKAAVGTISVGQTVEWDGVGGGSTGTVTYIRYRDSPAAEGFIKVTKDDVADPDPIDTDVLAVDVSNTVAVNGKVAHLPRYKMRCVINSITWYSPGDNIAYLNDPSGPGTHPNAVNEYDHWEIQNHIGDKVLFEYRHHFGTADSPAIYTNKMQFPNLNILCDEGFRVFGDKDADQAFAFIDIAYRMVNAGRVHPDKIPRN